MTMFHIGRRAPKGFVESGPGMHLGMGVWILPIKPQSLPAKKLTKRQRERANFVRRRKGG